MKNVFRIRINGLNLDRLINFIKSNYKVYNLYRIKYDEIMLDISYNNYASMLKKIDLSSYNITIINVRGYKHFLGVFKQYLASVLSVIIMIISVLILSTRILKINIYGASDNVKVDILKYLNDNNINIMSSNGIDINGLEQNLLENIDEISMVSTVIKGNVLIVNVKEKLPEISNTFADIIAPCNLMIDSINCYQGTPLRSPGEIVKKGEVLIGAYTMVGEKRIDIEPIYDIKYTTYLTGSVEFQSITKNLVRTGHKIINSCYNMFGQNFMKTNKPCDYEIFEEENKNISLFNNLFLPITIKKNIYYELEEVTITHDFDMEKDGLYLDSKSIAESKLIPGMTIKNTTQNIVDISNKKIIQTNIEVEGILTND